MPRTKSPKSRKTLRKSKNKRKSPQKRRSIKKPVTQRGKGKGIKKPVESALYYLTVAELKDCCRDLGLPVSGRKDELVARIEQIGGANGPLWWPGEIPQPIQYSNSCRASGGNDRIWVYESPGGLKAATFRQCSPTTGSRGRTCERVEHVSDADNFYTRCHGFYYDDSGNKQVVPSTSDRYRDYKHKLKYRELRAIPTAGVRPPPLPRSLQSVQTQATTQAARQRVAQRLSMMPVGAHSAPSSPQPRRRGPPPVIPQDVGMAPGRAAKMAAGPPSLSSPQLTHMTRLRPKKPNRRHSSAIAVGDSYY